MVYSDHHPSSKDMQDEMGGTFLRIGVLSCLRKGYEEGLLGAEPQNMERTDIFRSPVSSSEEQDNEGDTFS